MSCDNVLLHPVVTKSTLNPVRSTRLLLVCVCKPNTVAMLGARL